MLDDNSVPIRVLLSFLLELLLLILSLQKNPSIIAIVVICNHYKFVSVTTTSTITLYSRTLGFLTIVRTKSKRTLLKIEGSKQCHRRGRQGALTLLGPDLFKAAGECAQGRGFSRTADACFKALGFRV